MTRLESMEQYLRPFLHNQVRKKGDEYGAADGKKYGNEKKFISNPEYPYFSNGRGNCANFVSQCLYASGMDMTDGT